MRRAVTALALSAGVLLAATGCDDSPAAAGGGGPDGGGVSSPSPSPTPTPLPGGRSTPEPEGIDPRCLAAYPDVPVRAAERDLALRPEFWPFAPEFAAFCWWEQDSPTSVIAYYATDPGIVRAEVYRYYEHAMGERGEYFRIDSEHGELLTGVFPPEHSFYIEFMNPDRYQINFGIGGDYGV